MKEAKNESGRNICGDFIGTARAMKIIYVVIIKKDVDRTTSA